MGGVRFTPGFSLIPLLEKLGLILVLVVCFDVGFWVFWFLVFSPLAVVGTTWSGMATGSLTRGGVWEGLGFSSWIVVSAWLLCVVSSLSSSGTCITGAGRMVLLSMYSSVGESCDGCVRCG